jgi:hypothetical protein
MTRCALPVESRPIRRVEEFGSMNAKSVAASAAIGVLVAALVLWESDRLSAQQQAREDARAKADAGKRQDEEERKRLEAEMRAKIESMLAEKEAGKRIEEMKRLDAEARTREQEARANALNSASRATKGEASQAGQTSDDALRYSFHCVNGEIWRSDRVTGTTELVVLPGQALAMAEGEKKKPSPPAPPRNRSPVIDSVGGDQGKPTVSPVYALVPHTILDADRQRAEREINSYAAHIHIDKPPLRVVGDRVKGVISVSNFGARTLAALELTLVAETGKEGERPILQRLVLGNRPGQTKPPPPRNTDDREPLAVFLLVDAALPAQGASKVEAAITYLKFADE